MKKLLSTIVLLAVSAGMATAGDYYSKAPVAPKVPVVTPPPVCPCFDPGVELGLFAAGIFPDGDYGSDEIGGGVSAGMFFTENIGVNVSYAVFNTDSAEHFITGDIVFRVPIHELCIAPYVFAGGGMVANGATDGLWRIGGGVDIRMDSMGCVGLFIDGSYNWIDSDYRDDATIARVGIKIPF